MGGEGYWAGTTATATPAAVHEVVDAIDGLEGLDPPVGKVNAPAAA
jgi:hypothetical protein